MRNNIIFLKDISKDYYVGDITVHALRQTNLEIDEGEFVAVMGASGSGKSTLLNLLGCLDKPTQGEYLLNNEKVSDLNKNKLAFIRNRKLGFVFQSYNLLPKTTALENAELPLLYNNTVSSKQRKNRAIQALNAVSLSDRLDHKPNQLSGGQQQRVAIARSLVNDPVVILADEPTGNLDTRTSYEILALFQELNSKGITIVLVTHEPEIAEFTKRNIVFRDGRIIKDEFNENPLCAQKALDELPVED